MTEQEVINHQLQTKIEIQDEKFNSLIARIDALNSRTDATNQRIDDFVNEMRDRDNQRHSEMMEIRQSLQSIQSSGRNQTIATFLGIAAMVVAVLLK